MKPWILEKYPKSANEVFTTNSDIHYLVQLIDDLQNKYEEKIKKEQKSKNMDCSQVSSTTKISNQEKSGDNKKPKIDNDKKELKNKIQNKKVKITGEEDIKELRKKNMEKISSFLLDFIQENELNKKRANSMMSLRQSKTISSFTTCDDSICLEDKKDGKYRINLNLLIIDNSEINVKKNKTKDIIQKSNKLYQDSLKDKSEKKQTRKKFGNITGLQHNMTVAIHSKMYPKYIEIQYENEDLYIEYKNKKKLLNISPDLLLKKIIFENFITNHSLLIYHFCQQCFCFLDIEIFFKKIINCYKIYKNKNIPLDKLKNLIEFINILVIEMFEYYEKVNFSKMQISLIKKFYNELISDLITNFKDEEEKKSEVDEIKENENINSKRTFRFDSFQFEEENSIFNDTVLDKNNLLNMNLNFNEKNINILVCKDKNEKNDTVKNENEINNKSQKTKSQINNNKKENLANLKSSGINIEYPKFFKITKTLKNTYNDKYSSNSLNQINEEIKEENNEDDSFSSSSEEKKENLSDKENSEDEDIFLKEKKSSNEIINNLLSKVFNKNTNMLSKKDEIMNKIYFVTSLLEYKEGQIILPQEINEAKSEIPFYSDIKVKKKSIFEEINRPSSFALSRTSTFKSSFSIKPRSNTMNLTLKNYFCITDWNIEDIGDKLTEVSKSLLNKIHIKELLKGVYLKQDKNITSPNIVNCITNFNKLTSFIIQDVISYDTPKLRARAYEAWVQVCDYCKMNRNYNDCLAIYSALNNYIITGLNLTLKKIKSKTKSLFETISRFCTVEDNYRNIRNDMVLCEQEGDSFIPYLGMLLRDINFMEESFKYINEKGFINMEKIEKVNNLLEKYFKYKKEEKKKSNKKIPIHLNFFEQLEIIQEEELENRANNIEPVYKYDKQGIKTLTNIDKKFF